MHPIDATRRAKSNTLGLMPGISAMTITAGPSPMRNTVRVLPPWVNVVVSKSSIGSSAIPGP